MTVTILAVAFLAVLLAITVFGFKAVIRQGRAPQDANREKCSLCRQQYHTSQLLERQVGDMRVYYFCRSCIEKLHGELLTKN